MIIADIIVTEGIGVHNHQTIVVGDLNNRHHLNGEVAVVRINL